jgi:hypothetical protein
VSEECNAIAFGILSACHEKMGFVILLIATALLAQQTHNQYESLNAPGFRSEAPRAIYGDWDVVVSGNSICMDLQGIATRACTAGDPMIMLLSP